MENAEKSAFKDIVDNPFITNLQQLTIPDKANFVV
jgi:hypothetical protein